jgi:hypothetical protein
MLYASVRESTDISEELMGGRDTLLQNFCGLLPTYVMLQRSRLCLFLETDIN